MVAVIETLRRIGWKDCLWPLSGAAYGGLLALIIVLAVEPRTADRLARAAQAYCEASDEERAQVERRLAYRLPQTISLEIRCAR